MKSNLSRQKNITRLDYKKKEIFIYTDSRIEKQSRAFSCHKEPITIKWIEKFIKRGDTIIDIGANIGAYSLIIAKRLGNAGKVYAFEPAWTNFYQLNKNIVLNNLENKISCFNIALTNKKKIDYFNYRDFDFGSSLHTFNKPIDFIGKKFKPFKSQQIIGYTLDQFAKEFKIKNINHIKLDVDGIESDIIQGAKKTLSLPSFTSIMVELNNNFKSDMTSIRFLKSLGFKTQTKEPNPSIVCKSDSIYNYVFAKK